MSSPRWLTGRDRVTPFMRGAYALTQLLAPFLLRLTIEGLDRALPRSRPLIVASNHSTALDAILLTGYLAPAIGRPVHWMTKRELLSDLFVRPLMLAYGGFTVRRGAGDAGAFKRAEAVLDAGLALGVHPEGTRSDDGTLLPAKPGLALLATRTGAPILPVGIGGFDRFLPHRTKIPRPFKPVTLRYGEPFTVSLPRDGDHRAALQAAATEIMVRIGRLLPERQWGAYAKEIRASLA